MRLSYDALRVLREFLVSSDPRCGAEIIRALSIKSGTLYPLLARLVDAGWLEHVATLPAPDRPDSHFYKLTASGRDAFLSRLCRLIIPDHLWRENAA